MSTPTKTSVEMPTQPLTEAAKEAFHEALRDAESLGHPLCGPTARADARRSKAEALELIDRLADLASQPAGAGEWISLDERLPEENVPVLVTKDGGHEYLEVDLMEEGCWRNWLEYVEHVEIIGGRTSDVKPYTHWSPIPPGIPARGQQEGGE